MALHFSETAPGVHTATLANPKSDKRHNIAIIQSCDAWQLFIDGELAVRDLPSFKAAVSAAETKITSQRSPNMVRVAGILVMASIAGASFIGASKLIGAVLSPATVTAQNDATAKVGVTTPHTFKRVKPRTTLTAATPNKSLRSAQKAPVQNVIVDVTPTATTQVASSADSVPAQKPQIRRFSASNPLLGSKAGPASQPTAKPVTPVETVVVRSEPRVTTIKTETVRKPTPVETIVTVPEDREITTEREPVSQPVIAFDRDDSDALPALPTKAPISTRPVIRYTTAPIDQALLNEIEREEAEPVIVKDRKRATDTTTKPVRKVRNRKEFARSKQLRRRARHAQTKKTRRRKHTTNTSRRHRATTRPRRNNRIRTAEFRRPSQHRRMVCIAHSCSFR